MIYWNNMT